MRTHLYRSLVVALLSCPLAMAGCRNRGVADLPPPPPSASSSSAAQAEAPAKAPPAPAAAEPKPGPPPPARRVRPARLAGSWYPADPASLRRAIEGYLAKARAALPPPGKGALVALVVPHAGHRFSGPTAAFAYARVDPGEVRRIFVLGTDHRGGLRGIGLDPHTHFASPLGDMPIDTAEVRRLAQHPLFQLAEAAHAKEHAIEIQIPFLQVVAPRARLVPLLVGRMTLEEIGRAAETLRARLRPGDLLVAAGDFTHYGPNYGFVPFGVDEAKGKLDALARGAYAPMLAGDLEGFWRHRYATGDTVCGFFPVGLLLGILDGRARASLDHFDTSGRVTGDFTNSVSYVAASFTAPKDLGALFKADPGCRLSLVCPPADGLDPAEQHTALKLARDAVEHWVREGRPPEVEPRSGSTGSDLRPRYALTDRLRRKRAVFVTLNEHGRLRGCVGSIQPSRPLWSDIVAHAGNAALRDHRFQPVRPDELPALDLEVSVLTPPKEVPGPEHILVGRDGVILAKDGRRAVFLPQVPIEQGWDVPRMLTALSRKAGLAPDAWKRGARFYTFSAQVFAERRKE